MRRICPLFLLICTIASCDAFSPALLTPLDINGRWEINSELGVVRATCITIANNQVVRTGECDDSPGTTAFAYHPLAMISEHDEAVILYSVTGQPADPLVLFDLHRHADGVLRGTMIIYTNSVATTNSTITNVFWTRR